jgi:hypothetical protein
MCSLICRCRIRQAVPRTVVDANIAHGDLLVPVQASLEGLPKTGAEADVSGVPFSQITSVPEGSPLDGVINCAAFFRCPSLPVREFPFQNASEVTPHSNRPFRQRDHAQDTRQPD